MVILDKLPREKIYVDLIVPKTCIKDRPKFNILLKPFSPKPLAYKFYITQNKVTTIANLVEFSVRLSIINPKSQV